MISALRGQVLTCSNQQVVVDVSGVGYQVFVTAATANHLSVGDSVFFHTTLVVREDSMTIFGFTDESELVLFDLLRSVSGVGPKSALSILSTLSVGQVKDAVSTENDSAFKAVSGIGPKTAKLIVVALGGKLGSVTSLGSATETASPDLTAVISALQGLGWPERQAIEAVKIAAAQIGGNPSADAVLRFALASLGAGKSVSGS